MLRPTFKADPELLEVFFLAESLNKTVRELLTGQSAPMSIQEFNYWRAYRKVKGEIEKKAAKKKR